jgi:hypothetical protein
MREMAMAIAGRAVVSRATAKPEMILVAGPVTEDLTISRTGR